LKLSTDFWAAEIIELVAIENVTASCTDKDENTGFEFSVDDHHKNNIYV